MLLISSITIEFILEIKWKGITWLSQKAWKRSSKLQNNMSLIYGMIGDYLGL